MQIIFLCKAVLQLTPTSGEARAMAHSTQLLSQSADELCQGSTEELRGHREVSSERIGQPVSREEEEMLFPGSSCKTQSVMAFALLAGSPVGTTKG